MRPSSLAVLFSWYYQLASGQANSSVHDEGAPPPSATTNTPSLTSNTSFPAGLFPYIIPYNQPQQCNIFGAKCQTGLITISVNLADTTTTTTTLPCSSYLTAQADFLLSAKLESGGQITDLQAREWLTSFGRSPECKSYAGVHQEEGEYTFSGCGSENTIVRASGGFSMPSQVPPAVLDRFRPLDYACCGNCTLIVPEVKLFYFPDSDAPQCGDQSSNISALLSAKAHRKRVQPLNSTMITAVVSGHTFTSPSVYVQVVGSAAMRDECGSIDPILTNPIITLPPNVLSTYVPPSYSIGSTYTDLNALNGPLGFVGQAKPLKIADLQCPTFGLGKETGVDGSVHMTVGPPWLPVIIPPREVFTLDPVWANLCTDLASYYVFESFAIFDPPIALTPASHLVAPPPAASSTKVKGPSHVPADPTVAYDPPATGLPDAADPPNYPRESELSPVDSSRAPQKSPANTAQPAAVPLDPTANPTTAPEPARNPTPESQDDDSTKAGSSGLKPSIFSALEKGDPQPSQSGNADPTHIVPVPESDTKNMNVNGQILSTIPSDIHLSVVLHAPGGSAITLSDSILSLVSNYPAQQATTLYKDHSMNNQPSAPTVQIIADHEVVSNLFEVYVAGSTLSPGGNAITASNHIISLSPAGTLVIDSSSIALSPTKTQESSPANLKFDSISIQAEPSTAVIDGTALTPGGPGTKIDGNSISLEQGGTLMIGTRRLVLPPAWEAAPSAFNLDGYTIQVESSVTLIDGVTLESGATGVSINENGVSLEQDKTLGIETSHFALPTAAQATRPGVFNLNGMTVQAQQSAVVVNGVTLTPGGPGTNINGSSVSLESGGALDVGTGRFAIPTGSVNVTATLQTFEGSQGKAHQKPGVLVSAAVIVVGLCVMMSG